MAEERFPLLFIPGPDDKRPFTTTQAGGGEFRLRNVDPAAHARRLRARFDAAWAAAMGNASAVAHDTRQGVYLEFDGAPGHPLKAMSLEDRRGGIRLLNIQQRSTPEGEVTRATVFIPKAKRQHFLNKVEQYADEGRRRNTKLLSNIEGIRAALLSSFWTSPPEQMPDAQRQWVEVWLSTEDDDEIGTFRQLLDRLEVPRQKAGWVLKFPERSVLIVQANAMELGQIIALSDRIAEIRLMEEPIIPLLTDPKGQAEWAADLNARIQVDGESMVRVCILDTGVNRGHILLEDVLASEDMDAVDPDWGTYDHHKHGTLMAGVAIYRNLKAALLTSDPIYIGHRLESVKILPPHSENPEDRWVAVTTEAVARIEIDREADKRIYCMAVTSPKQAHAEPSTWSAAVDALASGAFEEDNRQKRLFIISVGNIRDAAGIAAYPNSNKRRSVESPAQAWNALSVGAFTQLINIQAEIHRHQQPIAPAGALSPYSTTSCSWEKNDWPVKPDVVFEGGNAAFQPNGTPDEPADLAVLSLWLNPQERQFEHFNGTSAATAEAAWMAARIQAEYPDAWPETLRALMVHSARWTDAMQQQFSMNGALNKRDLLRACGYGVPQLEHALYCLRNEATLVSQAELTPFKRENGRVRTNEMHLYRLPWPKEALEELEELPVSMRVTLSYFIEPGPDNVGWKDRYRYPSHGLRFRLINGLSEDEDTFLQRINRQEREDGSDPTGTSEPNWSIGSQLRNCGSIHSDKWTGTARELAAMDRLAVIPTAGWWKTRDHLKAFDNKTRYTLVVSIETPPVETSIYNLVVNKLPITIRARR